MRPLLLHLDVACQPKHLHAQRTSMFGVHVWLCGVDVDTTPLKPLTQDKEFT